MEKYRIDDFPGLVSTLGKAKADRIRYHQKGTGRRQPGAQNIPNTVISRIPWVTLPSLPAVQDILRGVALASDDERPLSTHRMFNILQLMPIINTREVQRMMNVSERQARKYVQAMKVALPLVEKTLTPEVIDSAEEIPSL